MHHAPMPARAGCRVFSDPSSLNGPAPGSSYAAACMQFATGDPAVVEIVMSGAIWTRCPVPSKPGDSSGAAEPIMTPVAVKEAVTHLIQAAELRQGPWEPTPVYLDALAVLHGTAADQVSQEMKYLAEKLAVVQEARAQGEVRAEDIDESSHLPDIITKPLQGKDFVFKRGRLLSLRVTPP